MRVRVAGVFYSRIMRAIARLSDPISVSSELLTDSELQTVTGDWTRKWDARGAERGVPSAVSPGPAHPAMSRFVEQFRSRADGRMWAGRLYEH